MKVFSDKGTIGDRTRDVVELRHIKLFDYIENMADLFNETGSDIDVVLTYEIREMWEKGNYEGGTSEHKDFLIGILDTAQMTFDFHGLYGDIVTDLKLMIDRM